MTKKLEWSNAKRKLSDLIPWPRNPRRIGDEQRKRLNTSLREFAQVETIAIGPSNEVYNGHQRLTAWAEEYGDIEVDVRVASRALTEKEREKLTVFLHKGAAGEWDFEKLADFDVADLAEWGFDAGDLAECGFDAVEAGEVEDVEPQIDKAAELREKWGVESGQLWQLGDHRLLCGDSTKAEDVARVMGGDKANAVLTDPPYGQNQKGVPCDDPENHVRLMESVIHLLPITDGVVIAFQSPRTFHDWTDAARQNGFTFERMLWMYKAAQCTFPWRGWILKSESIPVCSIGKANWQEIHPFSHDCYYLSEVSGELDKDLGWHGSVKPMSVVSDLLSRISAQSNIIYEPFSGSGTTIIAAEQLGRRCYAIEISPAYCTVTLQRWADATGKTPVLLE